MKFLRNLPITTICAWLIILLQSDLTSGQAIVSDEITSLIANESDDTAVGFIGGFGDIIGFRRYNAEEYTIFYSSDSRTTGDDSHSHARLNRGDEEWLLSFDTKGRLKSINDNLQNRIDFSYLADGSITFNASYVDGYAESNEVGKISATSLRAKGVELDYAGQTIDSVGIRTSGDPTVLAKVNVQACDSFPIKPLKLSIGYNYGMGKQIHTLRPSTNSGTLIKYTHRVDPLSGFRTEEAALKLVEEGYPGGMSPCKVSMILEEVCKDLGPIGAAVCNKVQSATKKDCPWSKVKSKVLGKAKKAFVRALLPDKLEVTAEAVYRDPDGNRYSITASEAFSWNEDPLFVRSIKIVLPCWQIFQGDFSENRTYKITWPSRTPPYTCRAPLYLGDRLYILLPLTGASGVPLVKLDYHGILQPRVGCVGGPWENTWTSTFPTTHGGNYISAYRYDYGPPPYEAKFVFDFDLTTSAAIGTYRFRFVHRNGGDSAGRLIGDNTISLVLPLIRGF